MQIYVVGGAIRDLWLFAKLDLELDFVVVGSTIAEMLVNYQQPYPNFPVFLDNLGQEYTLARKEYPTGLAYRDFKFELDGISLEEDLLRRDFTINAIAAPALEFQELLTRIKQHNYSLQQIRSELEALVIDPYQGIASLKQQQLVPLSADFIVDPLRFLRACRFKVRKHLQQTIEFKFSEQLISYLSQINLSGLVTSDLTSQFIKAGQQQVLGSYLQSLAELNHLELYGDDLLGVYQLYGNNFLQQLLTNSSLISAEPLSFNQQQLLLAWLTQSYQQRSQQTITHSFLTLIAPKITSKLDYFIPLQQFSYQLWLLDRQPSYSLILELLRLQQLLSKSGDLKGLLELQLHYYLAQKSISLLNSRHFKKVLYFCQKIISNLELLQGKGQVTFKMPDLVTIDNQQKARVILQTKAAQLDQYFKDHR